MAQTINIFVPDAFPDTNSVGRATYMMAKGLVANGERVEVTARWRSAASGWQAPEGIPTFTCGVYDRRQNRKLGRAAWLKSAGAFALTCLAKILRANAKCTFFYGASPLYLPAAVIARALRRRTAFVQYDLYRPTAADSGVKRSAASVYTWTERFLARSSRMLVVSESQLLIDHLSAMAPGVSIFPNWPPTDSSFFASGSRKRGRELAGVESNAETIVYTGAINRLEGVDLLIGAMKKVVVLRPRAQLVIAGAVIGDIVEGAAPDYHKLPADIGVEHNVKFLGTVDKEAVRDLLAASDCLVMPKRDHPGNQAASPIKLGEYLASGRPVVASNVCGIDRWLHNGQSIMLCEPGNIEDLADAIVSILENPEAGGRIGEAGKQAGAEHCDYIRWGRAFLRAWSSSGRLKDSSSTMAAEVI